MSKPAKVEAPTDVEIREEHFSYLFVEYGNASKAYREAYGYTGKYASSLARGILQRPDVALKISAIRAWHREEHDITVGGLLEELEEARALAMLTEQPGSAISATMGKAKMVGLDKQIVEHTGKDGEALAVTVNLVREAPMC